MICNIHEAGFHPIAFPTCMIHYHAMPPPPNANSHLARLVLPAPSQLNLLKTKPTRIALLLLVVTLIGSGCRTFHGFGQDVQRAGNRIEHAANR
jgi:predicted small secreted protein